MNTSFERTTQNDEWLTPPEIIEALGDFDLDPCAPIKRPWSTAKNHYTIEDDGLSKPWDGRVWLNPPYGTQTGIWLKRLAEHQNGIALTFARTETRMFFETVWAKARAVLFIRGRLKFYRVDGTQGQSAGAPSILIAYDEDNARALEESGIDGKFIYL